MKPASFKVRQSAFEGIIVSKENLNFSDSEKSILTLVSSTSAYSVEIKENPGNIFSFTTDESGVTFTVNRSQNRQNHSGRASIIPENPDIAPIYINLNLPKKDDYHYLSGIWTVAQNTDASGDKSDFVFTPAIPLASFNVTVQKAPLTDYPLTAEYIQGKVRIGIQGIGIDKATDTYYNIHFNGGTSDNPNGTYIFSTPGSAAWDAVPEFDESTHTITLKFENAQLDNSRIPRSMNFWCGKERYFNFQTKIVSYEQLVLTKKYIE